MIDSLLNLYGGVLVLSLRVEWAHLDVALRRIGCGLLAGPNSDGTVTEQAATADVVVVTNGPSVKAFAQRTRLLGRPMVEPALLSARHTVWSYHAEPVKRRLLLHLRDIGKQP